jgi:hypothetical protein
MIAIVHRFWQRWQVAAKKLKHEVYALYIAYRDWSTPDKIE